MRQGVPSPLDPCLRFPYNASAPKRDMLIDIRRRAGTIHTITVSLAQIDVVWGCTETNLARAEELATEAKSRGSDVIVFPELWTTGYDLARTRELAATHGHGVLARLSDMARRHGLYVTGSVLKGAGSAVYNCMPLFAPTGEMLGDYDKIHLFGPMEEDRYLTAGDRTPVFDLPWGKTALAICYDLRFPELFRKYALSGVETVFLCAEWPYPRLEHWRTLLRARAIENQCFLIACNRVGTAGGAHFFGHSTIVNPWGECLLEGDESEALLTATLDLGAVQEARSKFPVLRDRRPAVY